MERVLEECGKDVGRVWEGCGKGVGWVWEWCGKQAGKRADKQAGKHLEGIQSEPCPVGACYINARQQIIIKPI